MLCVCSFILADLAAVNRSLTPWLLVNGHRPIYPSSLFGVGAQSDLRVAQDLRNALEDLFVLHQVCKSLQVMLATCQHRVTVHALPFAEWSDEADAGPAMLPYLLALLTQISKAEVCS